jgi:hypothetical protein
MNNDQIAEQLRIILDGKEGYSFAQEKEGAPSKVYHMNEFLCEIGMGERYPYCKMGTKDYSEDEKRYANTIVSMLGEDLKRICAVLKDLDKKAREANEILNKQKDHSDGEVQEAKRLGTYKTFRCEVRPDRRYNFYVEQVFKFSLIDTYDEFMLGFAREVNGEGDVVGAKELYEAVNAK